MVRPAVLTAYVQPGGRRTRSAVSIRQDIMTDWTSCQLDQALTRPVNHLCFSEQLQLVCAFITRYCRRMNYVLGCPVVSSRPFVCSSRQILLPRYYMNGLNNFDKTDREDSLAPIDDPVNFKNQRSRSQQA